MSKLFKILPIVGVLLVGGCQSNEGNQVEIKSLKNALQIICSSQNYTFVRNDPIYGKVSIIYTEDAIGVTYSKFTSGLNAYIKDDYGVYPLNYENGYISGEYLLDKNGNTLTNLYSGEAYPTLYNVDSDYVDSLPNSNAIEITKKNYKMTLLKCFGFSESDYLEVNYIKALFDSGIVTFTVNLKKTDYKFQLTNVGNSKIKEVNEFLASNGKVLTLNSDLSSMRRLIRTNNFLRDIYDFSSDSYYGFEVFNPRYFYGEYGSGDVGYGAMSMNQKANEVHSVDLYGCYSFISNGSAYNEDADISFYPYEVYDKPDVTEYYHYPTFLKILDNMQFIHEGAYSSKGYSYQGSSYYFVRESYVYDFISNFSIDQSFDPSTYIPEAIGIDVQIAEDDVNSVITFVYYFRYGKQYSMPIPLRDFGNADISSLEKIADDYND